MVEAISISAVIGVITTSVDKYQSFQSFKEEANSFRDVLLAVRNVLQDAEMQFISPSGGLRRTRSLKQPLSLIQTAVEKGSAVLETCSRKTSSRV
jgi:hypothetical protein